MKRIENLLNYFIPDKIRSQDEQYRKARLLISVHLLMMGSAVFSYFLSVVTKTPNDFSYNMLIVSLISSLLIFKKYGTFIISGNILAVIVLMTLGPLSLKTGGIYSMDFSFMIILPLIAYLFANKISGFVWFGFLCVYAIILYLLELYGGTSFRLQTAGFGPEYYFVINISLILMITGVVWIFEEGQIANVKALKKSREILERQTITLQEQTNALKKQEESLKESNQELEHYAKVVSHDLREPLRNVNTYSQLMIRVLTKEQWINPEVEDYLKCINQNIVNMDRMINDLLEYSRLEADKTEQYTSMDFSDIIYIVSQNLNKQMSDNGVEIISQSLPTDLPVVPIKIIQLFQNLISNAIKFKEATRTCQIKISAEQKDKHWQFGIHDNGIGIKKDHLEKVFGLFHKLHHKSQYEGSGIGLATCKKIVQLHQGDIWVESEPDVGSTFYFTIGASAN